MENEKIRIGIIICQRYQSCAGGKCFRALRERVGAFKRYSIDQDVDIAAYTNCGGCPGGNVEYAPEEMIKNGVQVIHLATGLIVGYPPCPRLEYFKRFIGERYKIPVIFGTHPIPEKYYLIHQKLGTWDSPKWNKILEPTLDYPHIRKAYD